MMKNCKKRAIIETATRPIKSDIKTDVPSVCDQYPNAETIRLQTALDYITDSLRTLLQSLVVGKDIRRKVTSIGHAIIQAVRPRAIVAPLQLSLSVQMHHLY